MTAASWRKSSYSGSNGGACVEVGTPGPAVAVRDSNHPDGPQLAFAPSTWKAFTDQLKAAALPSPPARSGPRRAPLTARAATEILLPNGPWFSSPTTI